ncbi:MAG TPA: hypothetical protein VIX86_01215, partial [Streptosporangiaceae bacterium]
MGDQRAEDARHQGLSLGHAARQQQRRRVAVPDQHPVLGLRHAERPARFLGRVGQPADRADTVAAAHGRCRFTQFGDELLAHGRLRQHDMQDMVKVEQQVRQMGASQLALQFGASAAVAGSGHRQHAGRQVQPGIRDQG